MALFRRRARDKEEGAAPESAHPGAAPAPVEPREPPPGGKAPPAAPAPPARGAAPPPLPQRPPDAGAVGAGTTRFPFCFVCGSPLDAGACPVCKMTWVE